MKNDIINTHIYHRVYFDIQEEMVGEIINLYTESLTLNDEGKREYKITYHHRHYDEKEYNKLDNLSHDELKMCKEIVEKVTLTQEQLQSLLMLDKHELNTLTYEDFKKIGFIEYVKDTRNPQVNGS